jgi:hypothetical protein
MIVKAFLFSMRKSKKEFLNIYHKGRRVQNLIRFAPIFSVLLGKGMQHS